MFSSVETGKKNKNFSVSLSQKGSILYTKPYHERQEGGQVTRQTGSQDKYVGFEVLTAVTVTSWVSYHAVQYKFTCVSKECTASVFRNEE
jgi:hypothetical protein